MMNFNLNQLDRKALISFICRDVMRMGSIDNDGEYSEDFKNKLIRDQIGYIEEALNVLKGKVADPNATNIRKGL